MSFETACLAVAALANVVVLVKVLTERKAKANAPRINDLKLVKGKPRKRSKDRL